MKKILGSLLFTLAWLLLSVACSKGNNSTDNPDSDEGKVYVKMSINDVSELSVTANSPEDPQAMAMARITDQDLTGPDGEVTLPKHTLIISATQVYDQSVGKVKTLNLSIPDVTQPGSYDLIAKGGLFVYSDASGGMANIIGYTIGDSDDGSCTVHVAEVKSTPAGRLIKGTFTATVEDQGATYVLEGSFNGGL